MRIDYYIEDQNSYQPLQAKAFWNQLATDQQDLAADQPIRQLCEMFRDGTRDERAELRRQYAGNRNLLIFMHRQANQTLRRATAEWDDDNLVCLIDAITAQLIENCKYNYRDSLSYCGMLRYAADQCQLEFAEILEPLLANGQDQSKADEVLRYFAAMGYGKVSLSKLFLEVRIVADQRQIFFR